MIRVKILKLWIYCFAAIKGWKLPLGGGLRGLCSPACKQCSLYQLIRNKVTLTCLSHPHITHDKNYWIMPGKNLTFLQWLRHSHFSKTGICECFHLCFPFNITLLIFSYLFQTWYSCDLVLISLHPYAYSQYTYYGDSKTNPKKSTCNIPIVTFTIALRDYQNQTSIPMWCVTESQSYVSLKFSNVGNSGIRWPT